MSAHLLVTMGAPGSGKSTYVSRFRHVITTDALRGRGERELVRRVFREAWTTIDFLLATGREVVFDTTADHPNIRYQALQAARRNRARATLLVFDPPVEACLQAQQGRERPVAAEVVREIHASIRDQLIDITGEQWDEVRIVREEHS